ncbi:SDR family oxidoreductase [Silvanigrella aquatica]|uniref:Epimerase n=1 Tax=Silvanigrella aquatica TaxID=1915309 RepID=A0A1L4D4E1_9BACT|nr:SDR family oxidoreductase [Silvanigrella aquatica]APJ05042.1 epimerase [Silvanigrella aquatica]
MKILLTGSTGYIAKRLLPVLLEANYQVYCCVRDQKRFDEKKYSSPNLFVREVDFLDKKTLECIPEDIDIAFYLIHSMSSSIGDFEELEEISAINFKEKMQTTKIKQVIYLSGVVNEEVLSKHLKSRKNVENILSHSTYALTTLRAGIIVGSGSASFEIIRDLVEKLPIMIAPKWVNTKTQPISIHNVIDFLFGVIDRPETFNQSFDIGGPDILTYREMLLRFAKVRKLRRTIIVIPVMTPKLSSYWLYFVTATSYVLAKNLVNSMKVEVICKDNKLRDLLNIPMIDYETAIQIAFAKIEQNQVLSSWKDALTSNILHHGISQHLEVPSNGCYKDIRVLKSEDPDTSLIKIWSIGGNNGWYYGNKLWKIRGLIDQIFGGVGLRRGRKSQTDIAAGEALDFWRVLIADKASKRMLLYAEMKLPGEAWLEFKINSQNEVIQTATFRPLGLLGRLYWYSVWPFHGLIFQGMIDYIAHKNKN